MKLPAIRDLTEVFSQLRLEALGFRNFEDLDLVEVNKVEWGVRLRNILDDILMNGKCSWIPLLLSFAHWVAEGKVT